MANEIVGVVANSDTQQVYKKKFTTGANFLRQLYKVINCNLVEVVYLQFGGKQYCAFADEEGWLGDTRSGVAFMDMESKKQLGLFAHPMVIFRAETSEEGETLGLEEDDLKNLEKNMGVYFMGEEVSQYNPVS